MATGGAAVARHRGDCAPVASLGAPQQRLVPVEQCPGGGGGAPVRTTAVGPGDAGRTATLVRDPASSGLAHLTRAPTERRRWRGNEARSARWHSLKVECACRAAEEVLTITGRRRPVFA